MELDYVPATQCFILKCPRPCADIQTYVEEYGLDFSTSASTSRTAVLFTREPYAAVAFSACASQGAREILRPLIDEIASSHALVGTGHYTVPIDKELWGFQRADLDYAVRRQHCLIGDQPGLGKTPIAVAYANERRAKKCLVLCPAQIREQWMRVIREWTTMQNYHVHGIMNGRRGTLPESFHKNSWTVCSYDLARTEPIGTQLSKTHYDCLFLDEAHYLKTIDAERTRAVFGGGRDRKFKPIAPQAEHIVALTGTPLPNRPREAYTLARGLCFDSIDWASEDDFRSRFNPSKQGQKLDPRTGQVIGIYNDERTGREAELQARLRANFMTRHLKREVMTQLKMPVYGLIHVSETGAVKQALAAERLLDLDPETFEGKDATSFGHVSTVRMEMGMAMAPQVADYVQMELDGGEEKIVLFAWHHEVMDLLQHKLQHYGLVRVDGQTTSRGKQWAVDQFVDNPRIKVILGNLLSLGTGTDGLQKVCNRALIAEPDWVPGNNEQAFDRLDRGGQTRTVHGDIFVAPGSFAEKVLASALRKLQSTHSALDKRI